MFYFVRAVLVVFEVTQGPIFWWRRRCRVDLVPLDGGLEGPNGVSRPFDLQDSLRLLLP